MSKPKFKVYHPSLGVFVPTQITFFNDGEWVAKEISQSLTVRSSHYGAILMRTSTNRDQDGNPLHVGDIVETYDLNTLHGTRAEIVEEGDSLGIHILHDLTFIPLDQMKTVWVANGCKGDVEDSNKIHKLTRIGNVHQNPELLQGGNKE